MRNILILNGCPGSGKDTVSDYLVANYNYKTIAFKDSAYKAVYEHYNITKEEYMSLYNDRDLKDKPSDLLEGHSPRCAMQYVIEQVKKPKYGKDYLAKATIEIIQKDVYNDYVISDLGLPEEEIAVHYYLRKEKYQIIYINRNGYDFSKDTRSKRQIIHNTIDNNSDLDHLYKQVDKILKK